MRVGAPSYVLRLTCDGVSQGRGHGNRTGPAHLEGEEWVDVVFEGATEAEAVRAARAAGWLLGALDLCPRHARRYNGTTKATP